MLVKCYDNTVCILKIPWSTLILLPTSEKFCLPTELDFLIKKKTNTYCVIEVPCGTVIRVKKKKTPEYYLIDNGIIKLRGRRAKIIGTNMWGHHYMREDTKEKVLTVVYYNGRFMRMT